MLRICRVACVSRGVAPGDFMVDRPAKQYRLAHFESSVPVCGRSKRVPGKALPLIRAILLVLFLAAPAPALAWGLAAHTMITRQAVEACPEPLRADLRAHRSELVERSLEPDTRLRKRDGRSENVRHFLNLELLDSPPFTNIPADEKAARDRYSAQRLNRAGKLPWSAARVYADLVSALRDGEHDRAIILMGHLAHYASDARSPLHSTTNYDGRRTGNSGIHRLYESAMVQRRAKFFREEIHAGQGAEARIGKVARRMLVVLREGHAGVDAILAADDRARRRGEPGSGAYLDALFDEVGASARDRMRKAARDVAALWTSAWLESGRVRLTGGRDSRGAEVRWGGCGTSADPAAAAEPAKGAGEAALEIGDFGEVVLAGEVLAGIGQKRLHVANASEDRCPRCLDVGSAYRKAAFVTVDER